MSIKVMSAVWEKSQEKGNRLLLLLAIANFADDEGVAWPSKASLAKKIRLKVRAVDILVRRLIAAGELEILIPGGGHSTNRYRVHIGDPRIGIRVCPESGFGGNRDSGGTPIRVYPESGFGSAPNRDSGESSLTIINPSGINPASPEEEKMTPSEVEYLTQFKLKGFKTTAQRGRFQAAEALVGAETMLAVVAWAAAAGVQDVNRIYTAASKWRRNGNGDQPRKETNANSSDGHQIDRPKPSAEAFELGRKRSEERMRRQQSAGGHGGGAPR